MAVQRGQVWQLGKHRLMCGDATSKADVETLLNGMTTDLTLTDPPYGINAVKGKNLGRGRRKIGDRVVDLPAYEEIIGDDGIEAAQEHFSIVENASDNQVIFGGNFFTDFLPTSRCWLVWDKLIGGDYADGELAWTSFDKPLRIYQWRWSGMIRKGQGIWN